MRADAYSIEQEQGMKFDITERHIEVDALIERLDNPRHLAILNNYVRHANFEICALWDAFLTPDMIIDHPVYYFAAATGTRKIDGMAEVRAEYESYERAGTTVIYHTEGDIIVNDRGFISEYMSHRFFPGSVLRGFGDDIDDPDAIYLTSTPVMMIWQFNDQLILEQERSYRGSARTVVKCAPEDVISVDECREKLVPRTPPLWSDDPRWRAAVLDGNHRDWEKQA
jgi:hypothetical protein